MTDGEIWERMGQVQVRILTDLYKEFAGFLLSHSVEAGRMTIRVEPCDDTELTTLIKLLDRAGIDLDDANLEIRTLTTAAEVSFDLLALRARPSRPGSTGRRALDVGDDDPSDLGPIHYGS